MGIWKNIKDFFIIDDYADRDMSMVDSTGSKYTFTDWSTKFVGTNGTPIQECIFNTIANEFCKVDFFCERVDDKESRFDYYNKVLNQRTNEFLTPSSWKHIVAYQLFKYGNSFTFVNRDEKGNVTSLTPLDMDKYYVGNGYELSGGKVLIKLKNKETNQIELIDYSCLIHLRLNPNDIFAGDKNNFIDGGSTLVKLLDTQLNTMLTDMLNSGEVRGIVKVGSGSTGSLNTALMSSDKKMNKQEEVAERIRNSKGSILVLDAGEEWQSLSSPFTTISDESMKQVTSMIYTFKGINEKVINGTATEGEMEVFFNKTIAPVIEQFVEEVNFKLISDKDKKIYRVDYKRNPYEYIAINKAVDTAYKGAMFTTVNEMRKMLYKLPPIDGGDELIQNKNFDLNNTNGVEGDTDTNDRKEDN